MTYQVTSACDSDDHNDCSGGRYVQVPLREYRGAGWRSTQYVECGCDCHCTQLDEHGEPLED